ncbi:MAG: glycosyltransferase family 2 protein [Candidatus Magasanikbacteria bacterium]|nr:glycosyltransferase family 2 protein [Candidatus Magasanikbacteria bacterium]
MLFSIIIPLFNEERRLFKTAPVIFNFFKNHDQKTELIFVNDGSSDKTLEMLNSYKKDYDFKVVSYQQNRGKGYAVRQGVFAASGDWVIFFDIDLATPLEEFNNLIKFLKPDDQVVVGSRRLKNSHIERYESGIRTFLGQGFTKLSNILVPGITDFTCGFKCFSKVAAQKIFSVARIDRWGFDTELLYIAKLKKIIVRQMPVVWAHDTDSRVNVLKAVVSSLKELFEMKMNQIKGLYK